MIKSVNPHSHLHLLTADSGTPAQAITSQIALWPEKEITVDTDQFAANDCKVSTAQTWIRFGLMISKAAFALKAVRETGPPMVTVFVMLSIDPLTL